MCGFELLLYNPDRVISEYVAINCKDSMIEPCKPISIENFDETSSLIMAHSSITCIEATPSVETNPNHKVQANRTRIISLDL